MRPGRLFIVLAAAAVGPACALTAGRATTTHCPTRSAFLEPVRLESFGAESGEAVRAAEDDIRALFEESPDWSLAPSAARVDMVLRVDVQFRPKGKLMGIGGMLWARHPAAGEETLISEGAIAYDPFVGGPGPPTDFWRTLLSPLLTAGPYWCAGTDS